MGVGLATTGYHSQDLKCPHISSNNANPFEGPAVENIFVGDSQGNIILVPEGNWLTGSRDGKWIQQMKSEVGPRT